MLNVQSSSQSISFFVKSISFSAMAITTSLVSCHMCEFWYFLCSPGLSLCYNSITVRQIKDQYVSNHQYIASRTITFADNEDLDFNDHQFGNGETEFIVCFAKLFRSPQLIYRMQIIGHKCWHYPLHPENYFPAIMIDRMISDDELGPTITIIGEICFVRSIGYHQFVSPFLEQSDALTARARFERQAKEDEAKRRAERFAHLTGLFLYPGRCMALAFFPAAPRKRHPPALLKTTYDFESPALSSSSGASYIAKPQGLLNRRRMRIGEDFGNGSEACQVD
jgi:hypothetical protein